jgi:hypothetical protein
MFGAGSQPNVPPSFENIQWEWRETDGAAATWYLVDSAGTMYRLYNDAQKMEWLPPAPDPRFAEPGAPALTSVVAAFWSCEGNLVALTEGR